VQVDSIKPTLKVPGITLLKLKYDKSLSKFGFKFNLRRYNSEIDAVVDAAAAAARQGPGAYTCPLFGST